MDKKEIKKELKDFFSHEKDVKVVYLFGSTARDEHDRMSDVDVAVLGEDKIPLMELAGFSEHLKENIGRDVDVVDLRDKGYRFIQNVLKDSEVVLNRDEDLRIDFEAYTLQRYLDMKPLYRRFDRALKERYEG